MIKAYYEGYSYLNIIEAYRTIAIEATIGQHPGTDPLLNSLTNFKNLCEKNHTKITNLSNLDISNLDVEIEPTIFIISGYSEKIDKILMHVKKGANLVFINYKSTYISKSHIEENIKRTKEIISSSLKEDILDSRDFIYGDGRIFILEESEINDYDIEENFFVNSNSIEVENKKNIKIKQIEKIISRISLFHKSFISVNIISSVITQPLNESFFLEIEVKNISNKNIEDFSIELIYPDELYSLSNIFFDKKFIKSSSKFKIQQLVIPLVKGNINTLINIKNHNVVNKKISIPFEITVLDSYRDIIKENIIKNDNIENFLNEYEDLFKPPFNGKAFNDLLLADPETLVIKIRKISESIIMSLVNKYIQSSVKNLTFASAIFELHKAKIIDDKMNGFINTVRLLGNIAAHSNFDSNTTFNEKDAIAIANAFVSFVYDCVNKEIL